MKRQIDIGIDGILRGSEKIVSDAETLRIKQHEQIEQETRVKKAIVDMGFAWRVLSQDVHASAFRYLQHDRYGETALSERLALSSTITNGRLESIQIYQVDRWGGADYPIRVSGTRPDDMDISYYEFDDILYSEAATPANRLHQPTFALKASYFADRTDTLVNFLTMPNYKREELQP